MKDGRDEETTGSPYRSIAPRAAEPRPLEPEVEMKLALEAAERPRGRELWVLAAIAIVGVAYLCWAFVDPRALLTALYLLAAPAAVGVAMVKHRRRLARLRREGYDVDDVTRTVEKVRVDAGRVRVAGVADEDALELGDDGTAEGRAPLGEADAPMRDAPSTRGRGAC